MQIIAVDDEPAALFLLAEAIEKVVPQEKVQTFTQPHQALRYAEENRVDVAFLDQEMPGMDGITLGKKLVQLWPEVNVIYTTAYREYGSEAFALRASGYLLKPIQEADIRREMENLRHPIVEKKKALHAVTFGSFEFLKDGVPIAFKRSKSKEMLAYLIENNGAGLTKRELAAVLLENRPYDRACQDYMSKIIDSLSESLNEAGAGDVLLHQHNRYAVDTTKFTCDLYAYQCGEAWARKAFHGIYMQQYTWGEYLLGELSSSESWNDQDHDDVAQ